MGKKDDAKLVSEKAKGYFEKGFNWAESISLSFKEYLGIQDSLIPKLATGFGGGVGRKGSLCGAFTGAVMALGMKMGRTDPKDKEAVAKVYGKCQQFWDRFEKELGSTICYHLIGYHLDRAGINQRSTRDNSCKRRSLMNRNILGGRGRQIVEIPSKQWEEHLAQISQHGDSRINFMLEEHHRVRYFVVRELPRIGKPLSAEFISQELKLPLAQTKAILDELEKNLVFVVRNAEGAVSWAFPVTVDRTPHHLTFSTGEQLYGVWAEDAIATPFVQGRLRNEYLSVAITSECAHCGRAMHITVDSELKYQVDEEGAEPLVFVPRIDWQTFAEPNIINGYWRNSIFFWSEEHAREYRIETDHVVEGEFLTLEQTLYSTSIGLGALFAFT